MRKICFILLTLFLSCQTNEKNKIANPSNYLNDIKTELKKEWPNNRTINLVFHGHSVPAGYFKTPIVNTLESYPYQLLKELKTIYPYAVINIINTSIGGENSISGEKRFKSDVLIHKPDIVFIDYALNDRAIGLDKSFKAWNLMIDKALKENIKVLLLTPSPDQRINILQPDNELQQYAEQIKRLSEEKGIGLIDSYQLFKNQVVSGDSISNYMSQVNHPNKKGHQLISNEIIKYFK
ncbi:SGNH/GDSL hydrolase family protein [Kriegella aquimaris]|uniref:Lysophospholipase L1 n=1 Tax=Kriegella aquimaris TaxID=192904 RepID=A0A1G9JC32_9FLAO|nr:GDSL-type esterase/lipase family protein [Kriegella aquimaris]SDL34765.1 Lysophospholipase L1 [Kriegella aquimaris]